MVIISHPALLTSAERFAAIGALTESPQLWWTWRICMTSSHGVSRIPSNSRLLERAVAVWETAPRYVLLMGDASMDPRNYLGFGDGGSRTDEDPGHQLPQDRER